MPSASASAGVVTQAQLNSGIGSFLPGGNGTAAASPASWSAVWFGVAVAWILIMYFGFGGLRGSVAS